MTYTPLWTARAERIRELMAELDSGDLCPRTQAALAFGEILGDSLRKSFPDVSSELLGWVLIDVAADLKEFESINRSPGHRLLELLFVSGKALLEGGS